MTILKKLTLLLSIITFHACNTPASFELNTPKKIKIDKTLNLSITTNNTELKAIYYLDNAKIGHGNKLALDISKHKLGKHTLKVTLGETSKETVVIFLNSEKPKIYTYKVIASYPHNASSFTQGLEFNNNALYESTGQKGASVIKKVDLLTGKTLQEKALNKKYFGEGITIFNEQIYQLTWQGKVGFIYNLENFELQKTFSYEQSTEGWGLTHDDTQLIKSDGTEKIWFLNPKNGNEKGYIEAYTNQRRVENLNELEYINGRIYANVWTKNAIAIINPKNGAVEGIVNMKNLVKQLNDSTVENSYDKVLNGIAYNTITKKLYVTGKNWDKIFEIEITK